MYLCVCVLDVSLVISLNEGSGTSVQLGYEHTLTMHSPPTSFHTHSCLELMFTAQSQFSVKLVCVRTSGTYHELPLYSSRQPLGLTLHMLKLNLPVTAYNYEQCLLVFQAKTTTTGVVAAVNKIAVLRGQQCPLACKYYLMPFSQKTLNDLCYAATQTVI